MPRVAAKRIGTYSEPPDFAKAILAEIARTIDTKIKPEVIKLFYKVVKNWDTKITFKARKFIRPDKIWLNVFAAGPNKLIWKYVSEGTKAHPIEAKNAPFLVFNWGGKGSYIPKTVPGGFGGPGVVVGGTIRRLKKVNHPGTKPREFEKAIGEEYERRFDFLIRKAIRTGRKKAWQKVKSAA